MSRPFRCLIAVLALLGAAVPLADAKPKGLAVFKGKHTGVLLVAQGPSTRIVGSANFAVNSDKAGKSGRINVKGALSGTNFAPQIFELRRGGKVSVNFILPGFQDFAVPATGTFRSSGAKVRITLKTAAPRDWTATYTLQLEPGGGISSFSGRIDTGGAPIFLTVIGA